MNATTDALDESQLVATFSLGDAAFGIGAAQVQEVVRIGHLSLVHHAPGYVAGIRNLRGRIVTVIDLRVCLDLGTVVPTADARILIVDSLGESVGLLVDSITDTISVNPADILPTPSGVADKQRQYLRGVCRNGGRLVALLDPSVVLRSDDRTPSGALREQPAS